MNDASLVRMANQIAANCGHLPPADGARAIATHLKAFWAPVMRDDLVAHANRAPDDLDPLVLAAVDLLVAPAP